MVECTSCPYNAKIAVLETKMRDVERRCDLKDRAILDIKEKDIKPMTAWQNKAIGYTVAFSFIASLIGNYLAGSVS